MRAPSLTTLSFAGWYRLYEGAPALSSLCTARAGGWARRVEQAKVEHPDAGETEQKARCLALGHSAREACRPGSVVALDARTADLGREACVLTLRLSAA